MPTWRQITITGKTADIFEPTVPRPGAGVVIFLHGHGLITLKGNETYTALLEKSGLCCICPHGKRSWWGDVVCAEFDPSLSPATFIRENVREWISANWGASSPIALFGVSMGGQGAIKLAYHHPAEFPIVVALSPAIDFHNWYGRGLPLDELYPSAEAARQDTATLQLHPMNWPRHQFLLCDPVDSEWIDGVERLASKLSSTGIPFESDFKTGRGGHTWTYFNHMAPRVMTYIAESLEKERQRLPVVPPPKG